MEQSRQIDRELPQSTVRPSDIPLDFFRDHLRHIHCPVRRLSFGTCTIGPLLLFHFFFSRVEQGAGWYRRRLRYGTWVTTYLVSYTKGR